MEEKAFWNKPAQTTLYFIANYAHGCRMNG